MALPLGHGKAIAVGRGLTRRERWMIRGVILAVAILAVVSALAIGTAGTSSAHGCIRATIPGPVGAQEIDQCGSQARATCETVSAPGSFAPQAAQVIEQQCRKAGLAVGR